MPVSERESAFKGPGVQPKLACVFARTTAQSDLTAEQPRLPLQEAPRPPARLSLRLTDRCHHRQRSPMAAASPSPASPPTAPMTTVFRGPAVRAKGCRRAGRIGVLLLLNPRRAPPTCPCPCSTRRSGPAARSLLPLPPRALQLLALPLRCRCKRKPLARFAVSSTHGSTEADRAGFPPNPTPRGLARVGDERAHGFRSTTSSSPTIPTWI